MKKAERIDVYKRTKVEQTTGACIRKKIIGIFLAAGSSKRMGSNKLELSFRGTTIGTISLENALESTLDYIVVVIRQGDTLKWLDSARLQHTHWSCVVCEEAERGQSQSFITGITEAERLNADGAVILLADQPLIEKQIIEALVEAFYHNDELDFVASSCQGSMQPPLLFAKQMFPQVKQVTGDSGARNLIRANSSYNGKMIEYEDGSCFYDVDTKEDYKWIRSVH
ncbi:NTP transferase domain-containing protein [Bacillaceae bacterium Marseille-Q3522]|nr:NTP transferase domain-containing protein [Bacillaceae bacterium Marseille-Q3522]